MNTYIGLHVTCYCFQHLYSRITQTIANQLCLYLDYLPRKEMISNIHSYYDKYYQDMDRQFFQKVDKAANQHKLIKTATSDSVLFRMLVSPFAVCLSTDACSGSVSDDQYDYLVELLNGHLNVWRSWYDTFSTSEPQIIQLTDSNTSNSPTAQLSQQQQGSPSPQRNDIDSISQRDQSLLEIWKEEIKYEYAAILGGGFAPKADVVAEAMLGPDFVSFFTSSKTN